MNRLVIHINNETYPVVAIDASTITIETPQGPTTFTHLHQRGAWHVLHDNAGAIIRGIVESETASVRCTTPRHSALCDIHDPRQWSTSATSGVAGSSGRVIAHMPGRIITVKKQAGEPVTQGESIMVLEAMKMQNDILSTITGIIATIHVVGGQSVEGGFLLAEIHPADAQT